LNSFLSFKYIKFKPKRTFHLIKITSSLQKQLEHERQSRRKLENFIRKQIKAGNVQIGGEGIKNINDLFFKNYEHESSI